MTNFEKHIVGYTNRISVLAGDRQRFMVSSDIGGDYRAELVQLICGDVRARGAGFQERVILSTLDGTYPSTHQPLNRGSYGLVKNVPQASRISLHFYPTLLAKTDDQYLISHGSFGMLINDGHLWIESGSKRQQLDQSLQLHRWHFIEIEFNGPVAEITLAITALGTGEQHTNSHQVLDLMNVGRSTDSLVLAARLNNGIQSGCFNGKIEHVILKNEQHTIAEWHFENEIHRDHFKDSTSNLHHGKFFNCPVRATKGYRWNASIHDYRQDPTLYGAVHFHDDDITDAKWEPSLEWVIPEDLRSGQYAIKLTQDLDVEYITFFIRPAPHHQRARVAYLASTATYLAYANQRMFLSGVFKSKVQNENDAFLRDNIEVGLSLYEHHTDGSGVHYSSYLRPVLNLKPRGTMWSFNADTNITAWFHHIGVDFDVITDEDLHREGQPLLSHYSVVVTGTHPEYYSVAMLDAVENYLGNGGRLMYMGGNGFYWKIAYHPENPAIIEVRRAEDGTRAWIAEPGDYHHAFDGELGGLWRRNGRPPNQIVGIGFAAQGFDGATHYRLNDNAHNPRVAFIFEGVALKNIIGDYGSVEGGAAGQEIDRWDPELGSPTHALVLASSEDHKPGMLRVVEELSMSAAVLQGSKVRADMTFFETPSGGAVFSTGSISYAGSLAHNNYDNDISKITTNVLKRFSDEEPFQYP